MPLVRRTSGEKRFVLVMEIPSQEKRSPGYPGRFKLNRPEFLGVRFV